MSGKNTNINAQSSSVTNGAAKPRVLILTSDALFAHFFTENALRRLDEIAERRLVRPEEAAEDELRALIADADALITTWHSPFLRAGWFRAQNPLRTKFVAHCGGEVKARMEEEVLDLLTVANTPEPMANGVAEMALAMMLMLVRRIPQYVEEMRGGITRANDYAGSGEAVGGRRVGIVGFGRIGRAFARMTQPLGVELYAADPFCSPESAASENVRLVALDELLKSCSVVVLAAALTPATRHLLDARRLALLPDEAFLINVGRGGLIDLDALIDELRRERITAALDVTDPLEPLPADHVLRRLKNVYLTPHIAAGGVEVRAAMGAAAIEEMARFFRGAEVHNRLTRAMLATMT
ncbi:MAG TPA: hydroxyacid dehydrogenase [Pyrinomonadaceae bacterium]